MFFYLITILFCLILSLTLYDLCNRDTRLLRQIPGPKSYPIVGNSLNFAKSNEEVFLYMRSLHKEYGFISQVNAINLRIVNIMDLGDLEKILSSPEYINKEMPYTFLEPWLGEGLLTSSGKKWQHRRKLLTSSFHYQILKKFMLTFKEFSNELIKIVEGETDKDKTDVLGIMGPMTLKILCETAMGLSVNDNEDSINKYFSSILGMCELMVKRVTNPVLHNNLLFNLSGVGKRQKSVLSFLHGFTNNVIKNKRKLLHENNFNHVENATSAEKNEKMSLLEMLLQSEKNGKIDNEGIREEVDTFMLAGHDVLSLTLTYFLLTIANEPNAQEKVYEEVMQVLGGSNEIPTMDELNELKYLDRCMKEAMRLYTTTPVITRKLLKDTVLSGYKVPAGTNCFLYVYDMHRRADLYPDPERFDPDRFLPENCAKRNAYAFIPFSAGLRGCIGQRFATLEMKILLSDLIRKFRIEAVTKPSELVYKTDIVLRTTKPVYVRFRLRN